MEQIEIMLENANYICISMKYNIEILRQRVMIYTYFNIPRPSRHSQIINQPIGPK